MKVCILLIQMLCLAQVTRMQGLRRTVPTKTAIVPAAVQQKQTYGCPFVNLSEGRSAVQSSTYDGFAHNRYGPDVAGRAVDGGKNRNAVSCGECSITNKDKHSYWYVDIGAGSIVTHVILTGRRHSSYTNQLSDFDLYVTNKVPTSDVSIYTNEDRCVYEPNHVIGSKQYACESMVGQYVVIQNRQTEHLTICEAEVFGIREVYQCAVRNIALNRFAAQSSTYRGHANGPQVAGRGVDGGKSRDAINDGQCSTTNREHPRPYWYVDIGLNSKVAFVILTGRQHSSYTNQLSNFDLYVTNKLPNAQGSVYTDPDRCAVELNHVIGSKKYFCHKRIGHYVVIQMRQKLLITLCEAEVYGYTNPCS